MNRRRLLTSSFLALAVAGHATAAVTTWTVQSASSSLTISGALSSGGTFLASVSPQGAGSLTTKYSGTMESNLTASAIELTSSNIVAGIGGNWDPVPGGNSGTAPANYGPQIDLGFLGGAKLAIRELTLAITSNPLSLTGLPVSSQSFSGNLDAEILTGTSQARSYGIGGTIPEGITPVDLAGNAQSFASAGTIQYGPTLSTLTIPVSFTLAAIEAGSDTTSTSDDIGTYLTFTGNIVATAVVPEASSLVMLGLAGSAVGFLGYRRRCFGR